MNGRQVFRFATLVVSDVIEETLEKANLSLHQVDLIIPHQANTRIIETAAKKLNIEPERFYLNLDKYGNTSAASIPIALVDAVRDGRLQPNHNVVFVGFGGGLTWGASVVKWDVTPQPEQNFMDREWKRARYMVARGRSKLRRWGRFIGDKLAGSPTPDARLKDAGKKRD
jgi:3-oxoacyl-[acyl-carrier-protein] synthase-3